MHIGRNSHPQLSVRCCSIGGRPVRHSSRLSSVEANSPNSHGVYIDLSTSGLFAVGGLCVGAVRSVVEPSLQLRKRRNEERKTVFDVPGKGHGDRMTVGPIVVAWRLQARRPLGSTAGGARVSRMGQESFQNNSSQRGLENAAVMEVAVQPKAMPKP